MDLGAIHGNAGERFDAGLETIRQAGVVSSGAFTSELKWFLACHEFALHGLVFFRTRLLFFGAFAAHALYRQQPAEKIFGSKAIIQLFAAFALAGVAATTTVASLVHANPAF